MGSDNEVDFFHFQNFVPVSFQEKVPGFYFFVGGMTPGNTKAYPHHTPDFKIDDAGMLLGVKTMTQVAIDYLNGK